MTLANALMEYTGDTPLKLGTEGGTSFFYIGTVGDLRSNLVGYNSRCFEHISKLEMRTEKKLKTALCKYPTPGYYATLELKRKKPNLTVSGYQESLKNWFSSIERIKTTLEKRKEWLTYFEYLGGREVVTAAMCDPLVDPGVLRIVVKGFETGVYWTTDEAETLPACAFHLEDDEDG